MRPLVTLTALMVGCTAPNGAPVVTEPAALPTCAPSEEPLVFARAPGGAAEVDVDWLAANHCRVHVVDVRGRDELEGALGRIEGADLVPLEELEAHAATWPSDEPVVLVDRSGRRATRAAELLATLGIHRVASLTGGMLAWHHAGHPVTRAPLPTEVAPAPRSAPLVDPVRARLEDASSIEWVSVASIIGAGAQHCIDGRAEGPVVGTPGGDAGELTLALSALEHAARAEVDEDAVAAMLAAYAESFGRFYLHTDTAAMDRLAGAVARDARFEAVRDRDIESLVRHPPPELEEALAELLVAPEHVGCGHLRLLLQHPSEYGVRPELARAVLRQTHRLGWARPELVDYEILEGEHEEVAVVQVHLDDPVHSYTRVPTFPARPGDRTAFFVAHPEVSAYLRSELGSFLVEHRELARLEGPRSERVLPEALDHELAALAERQVQATLRHLARELPVYEVHLEGGAPEVLGPSASLGCRNY